jgi:hypothetical protein
MTYLFWLFFCIAAGMFAHYRCKRNGVGWFFVAFFPPIVGMLVVAPVVPLLFLSPIVAFVLLAILPVKGPKRLRVINPPLGNREALQLAFGDWNTVRNIGKGVAMIAMSIAGVAAVVSALAYGPSLLGLVNHTSVERLQISAPLDIRSKYDKR